MTLLEKIRKGQIPQVVKKIARDEGIKPRSLAELIDTGRAAILASSVHKPKQPCAVGKGLSTKVNVNLGTSPDFACLEAELKKLQISLKYKADAVMDLSTGGDLAKIRKQILAKSPISVGTVPMYEIAVRAASNNKKIEKIDIKEMLAVVEKQAAEGVDFMTLHCGLNLQSLMRLKKQGRLLNVVSRGGALLAEWMIRNNRENPLYEHFDRLLEVLHKYDVTISLGDGLRPGCIQDATDRSQIQELIILGELAKEANQRGVQAIIEGPGHMPLNEIKTNMEIEKHLCQDAPFYVLGPLVTDAALGYDHFAACIGSAVAATYGADFICYLTPAEHLGLPTEEDVKIGLIASRIAAHAADVARGNKKALAADREISLARRQRNFKKQISLAIEKEKPAQIYKKLKSKTKDVCSMCSEYCAVKIMDEVLK